MKYKTLKIWYILISIGSLVVGALGIFGGYVGLNFIYQIQGIVSIVFCVRITSLLFQSPNLEKEEFIKQTKVVWRYSALFLALFFTMMYFSVNQPDEVRDFKLYVDGMETQAVYAKTATTAKTLMPAHTKVPNTNPTLNSVQLFAATNAAERNSEYTPKPDSWYIEKGQTLQAKLPLGQEWYADTQITPHPSTYNCLHWDQVGLQHVGQTLCVYGTVRKAWIDWEQNTFFMTFGTEPTDFYMLTYGGRYFLDIQNYCSQAEGEIMQIGQAPVMVVDPGKLFECD